MRKAKVSYILIAAILGLLAASPFLSGTGSLPIAIVEGNSMYPTLQNGDLVIFTRPPSGILPNGTIIIFTQTTTGDKVLDSLIMPIVIHRVVGTVIQFDGVVYYRTKGDNNQFDDPQLVRESRVLGVPSLVIPKVGILILFLKSPQGLITIVSIIVFLSLNSYEAKRREDELKNRFLTRIASLVLAGKLSREVFERLELIVKYSTAKVDWLNIARATADAEPLVYNVNCPRCTSLSAAVELRGQKLIFCQNHFLRTELGERTQGDDIARTQPRE